MFISNYETNVMDGLITKPKSIYSPVAKNFVWGEKAVDLRVGYQLWHSNHRIMAGARGRDR